MTLIAAFLSQGSLACQVVALSSVYLMISYFFESVLDDILKENERGFSSPSFSQAAVFIKRGAERRTSAEACHEILTLVKRMEKYPEDHSVILAGSVSPAFHTTSLPMSSRSYGLRRTSHSSIITSLLLTTSRFSKRNETLRNIYKT